jgi:Nif-specific regulatory protein
VSRLRGEVDGREAVFTLTQGDNTIGANPESSIHLPVPKVSRQHAVIRVSEGEVVLDDLDSTNGTFVNGIRVRTKVLEQKDWVQVGPLILTFESIPASEHELAFALDSPKEKSIDREQIDELPSTELSMREGSRIGWLTSLNDFAAVVFESNQPKLDVALTKLGEAVSATSVAYVDWGGEGSPSVLACSGELSSLADALKPDALVHPESSPQTGDDGIASFRPRGSKDYAAAVERNGNTWTRTLVMSGDRLPYETTGLLELALRILVVREPESGMAGSPTHASPSSGLVFPDWHVKGHSPTMHALYRQMESFARSSSPVLVTGETGVGKEHIVRILHASSDRASGRLQVVNCAAIPSELLEAELFGIEARVATGVDRRPGKLKLADGGTLFLDEVGDMDVALQAKLLRALQEGEAHAVGAPSPVRVDVRVVAATNADLEARVREGQFRKDLYYRIAGCELHVPPLQHRREDIPGLVDHFLRRAAEDSRKNIRGLSMQALAVLQRAEWPGNIRQLQREVERLVASCPEGQVIESLAISQAIADREHDGPAAVDPDDLDLKRNLEILERRIVIRALRRAQGNHSEAARLLGVTRSGLTMKMERLGIER